MLVWCKHCTLGRLRVIKMLPEGSSSLSLVVDLVDVVVKVRTSAHTHKIVTSEYSLPNVTVVLQESPVSCKIPLSSKNTDQLAVNGLRTRTCTHCPELGRWKSKFPNQKMICISSVGRICLSNVGKRAFPSGRCSCRSFSLFKPLKSKSVVIAASFDSVKLQKGEKYGPG